jgi:hypothetical protein
MGGDGLPARGAFGQIFAGRALCEGWHFMTGTKLLWHPNAVISL